MTDTTHITCVLDESGSMGHLRESVVAGFNEFVDGLKGEDARVSLILFASSRPQEPDVRMVFTDVPMSDVQPLTIEAYRPGGGTPLRDATGAAITDLRSRVNGDKALIAIWTDGQENSSKEVGPEAMRGMTADAEKDGWAFLYLGANQDSWAQASNLGITPQGAAFHTSNTVKGLSSSNKRASAMAQSYLGSDSREDYMAVAGATPDWIAEDEDTDAVMAQATAAAKHKQPDPVRPPLDKPEPKKDHYTDAKSATERAREVMRGDK